MKNVAADMVISAGGVTHVAADGLNDLPGAEHMSRIHAGLQIVTAAGAMVLKRSR